MKSYYIVKDAMTCPQTLQVLCESPSFEKMKEVADSLLPTVNEACRRQYDSTHQRFTISNDVFHGAKEFWWHRDSFPFEPKDGQEYQGWLKCSEGNDMMLVPLEENDEFYKHVRAEDAGRKYRNPISLLPNGHMLYGTFHSPTFFSTKPVRLAKYRGRKLRVIRLQLNVGDLLLFDNRMFHSHVPSWAVRWGHQYEVRTGFTFRMFNMKHCGTVTRSDFDAFLADVCETMQWTTMSGNTLLKYITYFSKLFEQSEPVKRRTVTDMIEEENRKIVENTNRTIFASLRLNLTKLNWWLSRKSAFYLGCRLHLCALQCYYQFWKISKIYGHSVISMDTR